MMPKPGYKNYLMSAMPGTRQELRAKTGLGATTITRWIKTLHELGEIHISGWHRPAKGVPVARYSAGPAGLQGEAKCRIRPMSAAQVSKRYRQRIEREDPDRWDVRLAMQANYARERRASKRPKEKQQWFSALL